MAIETGKTGRPLKRKVQAKAGSAPPRAVAKRRLAEIEPQGADSGAPGAEIVPTKGKAATAAEVLLVEDWYIRGFTRPPDLAKLVEKAAKMQGMEPPSEARIRATIIPAILRRLARGMSSEEAKAQAQHSIEAQRGLLRFAWNEMLRAGKPSVKVQWAQIINTCHDRIDKLTGVLGREDDQKSYTVAINVFLQEAVNVAESTNDPAVLQRMEAALKAFLVAKGEAQALPGSTQEPVDAEFTELPEGV